MERRSEQIGVGTLDITECDKEAVLKVLESNRLTYGPVSREFEERFASLHDSKFAVLVNSGTSALRIAIACLKETEEWRDGDEVLVPALTFVATANVVLDHGLRPVFVDCDPRTYNIDPRKIEEKITGRTRAIIPVHLFGLAADMDPICALARKHNLKIIEDSAETVGMRYKERMVGSFGDISCFSTYTAHLVVTGVGGLVVTNNPLYADILRSLANHGRDTVYVSIDDDKNLPREKLREVIRRRFRFIRPGYSFRLTEMEAALGLGQLKRLHAMLARRRANAGFLRERLAPFADLLQLPWYDAGIQEHAFMMFPVALRRGLPGVLQTKEALVQFLEEWNIETRDMLPLINQPVYASLRIRQEDYPVADWVNRCGFYIACHQALSRDDLQYMVDIFGMFFASHGETTRAGSARVEEMELAPAGRPR